MKFSATFLFQQKQKQIPTLEINEFGNRGGATKLGQQSAATTRRISTSSELPRPRLNNIPSKATSSSTSMIGRPNGGSSGGFRMWQQQRPSSSSKRASSSESSLLRNSSSGMPDSFSNIPSPTSPTAALPPGPRMSSSSYHHQSSGGGAGPPMLRQLPADPKAKAAHDRRSLGTETSYRNGGGGGFGFNQQRPSSNSSQNSRASSPLMQPQGRMGLASNIQQRKPPNLKTGKSEYIVQQPQRPQQQQVFEQQPRRPNGQSSSGLPVSGMPGRGLPTPGFASASKIGGYQPQQQKQQQQQKRMIPMPKQQTRRN